jgi:hypothetical protein
LDSPSQVCGLRANSYSCFLLTYPSVTKLKTLAKSGYYPQKADSDSSLLLTAELRLASLDAAELYAQRGAVLAALAGNPCATCPVVPKHYREYRQHALLRERVRHLKHELSDANLQQMPDFEQRVSPA